LTIKGIANLPPIGSTDFERGRRKKRYVRALLSTLIYARSSYSGISTFELCACNDLTEKNKLHKFKVLRTDMRIATHSCNYCGLSYKKSTLHLLLFNPFGLVIPCRSIIFSSVLLFFPLSTGMNNTCNPWGWMLNHHC
jgi:hypothetical protein